MIAKFVTIKIDRFINCRSLDCRAFQEIKMTETILSLLLLKEAEGIGDWSIFMKKKKFPKKSVLRQIIPTTITRIEIKATKWWYSSPILVPTSPCGAIVRILSLDDRGEFYLDDGAPGTGLCNNVDRENCLATSCALPKGSFYKS